MVWSHPDMNGTPPCGRGGHSAILADTQLVLFGGHYYGKGGFVYLNDVHVLDVETSTWHDVRCAGEPPPPRYGHTSTLVGRRMFVFGGKGENNAIMKDMYFLDLDEWCWSKVNPTTTSPHARFDHADVLIGSKIVIFGGWDGRTVLISSCMLAFLPLCSFSALCVCSALMTCGCLTLKLSRG